jgi:vacuolar-type H+-ATPase subunit I/STV1
MQGEGMDNETKECIEHFQKDMVHQFHIMVEHVINEVQIVAEGVASLSERVDRQGDELNQKIAETQTMMGMLHRQLDKKINETADRLDKKIDRLDKKIDRLDKKIDKEAKGLRVDILRVESKVEMIAERLEEHERVMHHL